MEGCYESWRCHLDILVIAYPAAALGLTLYLRNVDMNLITDADPESEKEQAAEKNGTRQGGFFVGFFFVNRGSRFEEEVNRHVVGGRTKTEGVLASEVFETGPNDTLCSRCVHVLCVETTAWTPEVPGGTVPHWPPFFCLQPHTVKNKPPLPALSRCPPLTPSARSERSAA